MSKTANGPADFRDEGRNEARQILGTIRRMVITVTREVQWQIRGITLLDGKTLEVMQSEIFSGIGFYSRPQANSKHAEAALLFNGGDAEQPLVVATRDERLRKDMAGDFKQNETGIFNSLVRAFATASGKFRIGTKGGSPDKIPTWADFVSLRDTVQGISDAVNFHQHTVLVSLPAGTGNTQAYTGAPAPSPAAGTGTTVLEAE